MVEILRLLAWSVAPMLILGCTVGSEPSDDFDLLSGEVHVAEIVGSDMVVTYPAGWYLAEEDLTPIVGNPREVFTIGSFPMRPGGPNCAQFPTQAMHDLTANDVLVTLQERRGAHHEGFDPRPERFGPVTGSSNTTAIECLNPEERADVGTMHWIWFTEHDRYFHALVVLGREASRQDVLAAWSTLDHLVVEPRS